MTPYSRCGRLHDGPAGGHPTPFGEAGSESLFGAILDQKVSDEDIAAFLVALSDAAKRPARSLARRAPCARG
jgi:hypothetical protein